MKLRKNISNEDNINLCYQYFQSKVTGLPTGQMVVLFLLVILICLFEVFSFKK